MKIKCYPSARPSLVPYRSAWVSVWSSQGFSLCTDLMFSSPCVVLYLGRRLHPAFRIRFQDPWGQQQCPVHLCVHLRHLTQCLTCSKIKDNFDVLKWKPEIMLLNAFQGAKRQWPLWTVRKRKFDLSKRYTRTSRQTTWLCLLRATGDVIYRKSSSVFNVWCCHCHCVGFLKQLTNSFLWIKYLSDDKFSLGV